MPDQYNSVAQRVGLSVAEIRQLMSDLPECQEITIDDWVRLRHRLEAEVRRRIKALTDVLDNLTSEEKLCELPSVQHHGAVMFDLCPV